MDPWRPNRPEKRDDFEVAIICALTLEADAIIALFDYHWEDDGLSYGKARGDPNAYSTGVMGQHNVVLAHLPGMGKVSAGNIAAFCRMSFPNIKLALLVGICGGAPYDNKSKSQICLGDVVISTGIVQYDFGRRFPDKFEIKDSLNDIPGRPNVEIRNLLSKLMTARESERLRIESWKYLNELCQDVKRPAVFPGRSKDLLFPVHYRHKHQDSLTCMTCASCHHESDPVCDIAPTSSCDQLGCDTSRCLQRANREEDGLHPLIHYGVFATGDTVMKSARDRDHITKKTQALGFEMESVGVWEVFPCVVIKSVSDYADSHKTKDWQPYAAACAASYAKGFLRYWDSNRKEESVSEPEQFRKRIIQSLSYSDMNERRNNISSEAPSTFNWIFEESVEDPVEQDLEWPSSQDSETNRHPETEWETDTTSDEESGQEESLEDDEGDEAGWETTSDEKSGEEESPEVGDDTDAGWGTESDERSDTLEDSTPSHRQQRNWDSFVDWLKSDLPVYWITGKPGSGKSTLMKYLISDSRTPAALKKWKKDAIIIAHFFWKPGSTMQHSFKGFLCSLVRLILTSDKSISNSSLQRMITDEDGKYSPSDWDPRELKNLLLHYRNHSSQPICIFIDALDEISPEQDTLDTLQMLGALISPTIKLCVSSRPERLFRLHLQDKPRLEIHELTAQDIEQYSKVSIRSSILQEPQGLKASDLARRIREMSEGVFLWAVLVTRSLIRGINNGDSNTDIDRRLNSTPRDLKDLYRDILLRSAIDRDIYQQSVSLIFSLVFAVKSIPMSLFELMMATDGRLLDQFVVQQKSIIVQDLETKRLRMMNTLEAGCAGLLDLNGNIQDSPADSGLEALISGLEMRLYFIHRSAEEFLLDTEEGRKLWESCPCSRAELLIRRTKASLAWFELYTSLNIESRMRRCTILDLNYTLDLWMDDASLPDEVSTSTLNLAQRMYERGSILPPMKHAYDDLIVSRSHRSQISFYAATYDLFALAKQNLATLPYSESHETAYCIFYYSCTRVHEPDDDGNMLEDHDVIQIMLNDGYNPNWPGISETSTCKFGSPWLRYLLSLYGELSHNPEDILNSTQALTVLDTIRMFLNSGASVHSRFKTVFMWSGSGIGGSYAGFRLAPFWCHAAEASVESSSHEFLVLEINAKVLLESILVQVHRVIRHASRLKVPEAAPHMKALAFGNYEKSYFIVDADWMSDLLVEGVKLWFQHGLKKHDGKKLNSRVMTICSYATEKARESCRRGPWPFELSYDS